jgi:hypothetical protein
MGCLAAACSGQVTVTTNTPGDAGVDAPQMPPPPPAATDAGPPSPPPDAAMPRDASLPPPPAPGGPPVAPPDAGTTTTTTEQNFATKTLFMGDTDRNGVANLNAWKSFGYDMDGKTTTAVSTDVCTLFAGAPKSTQIDGDNGIDNSFGANILPILLTTAGADFSTKINASIAAGNFTFLYDVTGLDGTPSQTATGLHGFFDLGDPFGQTAPTFTTADDWPVDPTSLNDPSNPRSSKYPWATAYVTGGLFVSGPPSGTIVLPLSMGGAALPVTIHQAVITWQSVPGQAANGTIAGVLDTEEFIAALQQAAGRISTSLCAGQAFDSIASQIRQASDILKDGSNAAGVACDGISIGLGFNAVQIALPSRVGPAPVQTPDPCADGG